MNYIWNKNIALLKTRFPSLYKIYEPQIIYFQENYSKNLDKLDFWKISIAKNGQPTVFENNRYLHSTYNPQKEAESIISNIKNKTNIIFLGFGLGYHAIEVSKEIIKNNDKTKKLILIENDLLHFFGAISILDWEIVFNVQNLILALSCPENQIIPLIENQNSIGTSSTGVSDSYILDFLAFTNHNQNYFDTIKTLINRNKTKNEINTATFKKFSKLWIRNSISNLTEIKNRKTVNQFLNENKKNLTKDFILIAAGPSLKFILPKLKEIQKNYFIIAVETSLKALLKEKIEPDFIVITDPQYYALRHILGLKSPSSTLICPISVHPAVFRFDCKQILICSDLIPISEFFEKEIEVFGDLGSGGSVASCAWTFSKKCGAKNIYLAGLDLSYPQKETHIKGSSAEQTFHTISKRINPVEKLSCTNLFSANSDTAYSYDGNIVLTDSRMKMFAWWFESKIACETETTTFSLCKESMKIPGVQTETIENLIEKNKCVNLINTDTKFSEIEKNCVKNTENTNMLFEKCKENFFVEYKKITYLLNRAIEACIISSSNLQTELAKIDNELFNSKLSELIKLSYKKEENPIDTYLNIKKLIII